MQILNELSTLKRKQSTLNEGLKAYFGQDPKVRKLYADKKKSSAKIVDHTLNKVDNCGGWLHLREWLNYEDKTTVKAANFCKQHLLCRSCAIRRASKTLAKYAPIIEQTIQDAELEGFKLVPAMVTLTVRNDKDLMQAVNSLKGAWRRMTQETNLAKKGKRGYQLNEWSKVVGYIKSMEITNKGNGWHPHFHVLVLLSEYIDQKQLSKEWEGYTNGSKIVGVTEIKELEKGLYEVLKYATKFSELEPAQVGEVWASLRGSRFFDSGGILRGVKEVETLTDEDLEGPYVDYFALWQRWEKAYKIYGSDPAKNNCDPRCKRR